MTTWWVEISDSCRGLRLSTTAWHVHVILLLWHINDTLMTYYDTFPPNFRIYDKCVKLNECQNYKWLLRKWQKLTLMAPMLPPLPLISLFSFIQKMQLYPSCLTSWIWFNIIWKMKNSILSWFCRFHIQQHGAYWAYLNIGINIAISWCCYDISPKPWICCSLQKTSRDYFLLQNI